MDVSFSSFLSQMGSSPVLLITVALTLGVILSTAGQTRRTPLPPCHHALHECARGNSYRCRVPLPGRVCDDQNQQLCGLHHQQYGRFWRRHAGGSGGAVRGTVFHCGVQRRGLDFSAFPPAKATASLQASPARPLPFKAALAASIWANGPRCCMGWCSALRWGLPLAGPCANW